MQIRSLSRPRFLPPTYPSEHQDQSYKKSFPGRQRPDQDKLYELIISLLDTTKTEAEAIRLHITDEITKTRVELIKAIKEGNLTIIDCIKFNSVKNIQIISLMGIAVSFFSLLISFLLKINIINPFFAALFLITSFGFYVMTLVEQKRSKLKHVRIL